MKKGWKRFWIICAICAGIGLLCCMLSLVMGVSADAIRARFPGGIHITDDVGIFWGDDRWEDDDDFDDMDDLEHFGHGRSPGNAAGGTIEDGNSRAVYQGKEIHSLDADVWGVRLEVVEAEEGATEIVVEGVDISDKLRLHHYVDEGELKIETAHDVRELRNKGETGIIYVHVPRGYKFAEASLDVEVGEIYIDHIYADELSVETGVGMAEVVEFTADHAEFQCGTGELTVAGTVNQNLDMECDAGEISVLVNGSKTDFNYEIECGLGSVLCEDEEFSGIGGTKTVNNKAPKNMDVECGMGTIEVSFVG